MTKFIIGKKSGMTQLFDENGNVIPATVIECEPMYVLQNKTVETDGYKAVKVGTGTVREKLVNKPDKGQFKKADVEVKRYIREFKIKPIFLAKPCKIRLGHFPGHKIKIAFNICCIKFMFNLIFPSPLLQFRNASHIYSLFIVFIISR